MVQSGSHGVSVEDPVVWRGSHGVTREHPVDAWEGLHPGS